MTLCFASFIKVLKICAKPKVYNKTLCEAVVKTFNVYTGNILGSDDAQISHLLSCKHNLSPDTIVIPMREVSPQSLSAGMNEYVVPLLKNDMIPYAILALRDMALSTVKNDDEMIGSTSRHDLALIVPSNPADFFADVFFFTATEIDNKDGKDDIKDITNEYVKGFCEEKAIELPPPNVENGESDTKYSEQDSSLLKEFQDDYDEIISICISDKFAQSILDGLLLTNISDLYENKWKSKSEQFQDMELKSKILMLLVKLKEFRTALDPKIQKQHMPIRLIQKNLRNLYVKLHPDEYLGMFHYDLFTEDWDEGEDY